MKRWLWNRWVFVLLMLAMTTIVSAQERDSVGAKMSGPDSTATARQNRETMRDSLHKDTVAVLHAVSEDTARSVKAKDTTALSMGHKLESKLLPKGLKIDAAHLDSAASKKLDSIGNMVVVKIKGIEDRLAGAVVGQVKGAITKIETGVKELIPDKSMLPSKKSLKNLIKLQGGQITLGSTVRYSEGGVRDPIHYQASADIRASISVGMLPFNMGASATYGDRQFNYQFSKIGFDFNSSAFLDSMKKKAMSKVQTDQLKDMASINSVSTLYESGIKQMDSSYDQIKKDISYSSLKFTLEKYETQWADSAKKQAQIAAVKIQDTLTTVAKTTKDSIQKRGAAIDTAGKLKQVYDSLQILRRYYDKANEILGQVQKYKETLQQGYEKVKSLSDDRKQLTQLGDGKDLGSINKLLDVNKLGFNKLLRAFAFLKKFSIGSSILNGSALTASNYRLNGIQLEYNPSYIIGFAAGLNNFRLLDYLKTHKFDDRFIVHTRLGYGDLKKNYIVFNYGFGKILNNQMRAVGADYSSPLSSYLHVFSLETQWTYKNFLKAKGEIAYSLSKTAGEQTTGVIQGSPSKPTLDQMAFTGEVKGNVAKSFSYRASFSYLGGSFKNFNEAYQNNNLVKWDVGFDEKLFKNKLSVSFKYIGFKNNLNHQASYGSLLHQPLLNLTVHVPKYPVITIVSSPMYQDIHIDTTNQHNTTILNSVSILYPYFKKQVMMSSMINLTLLNTRLIGEKYFTNDYYVVATQTVSYKSLTVSADLGYSRSMKTNLLTAEPGLSYRFSNRLMIGAKFKAGVLDNTNVTYGGGGNISCDFKKFGMLKLNAEQSSTPNFVLHTFQNFLLVNFMYSKKF